MVLNRNCEFGLVGRILITMQIGMILAQAVGCGPATPERKAEIDISEAESDLAKEKEVRALDEATGGDDGKMTELESPKQLDQQALAELNKAIEEDPNSADAYYERGFFYIQHDEELNAIDDFTQAIKRNPKLARAFLMRSRAYEALGETDRSKKDREEALRLDPNID